MLRPLSSEDDGAVVSAGGAFAVGSVSVADGVDDAGVSEVSDEVV